MVNSNRTRPRYDTATQSTLFQWLKYFILLRVYEFLYFYGEKQICFELIWNKTFSKDATES